MSKRKTEKDYHELAKHRGFKWVGGVLPKNTHMKTWWECNKKHRWEITYHCIQQRHGCPVCYGNVKKTEKDYHTLAKSRRFKWVSEVLPKNIMTKTWWKCEKGHKWQATYNSIWHGNGCLICSGKARKTKKDYYDLAKFCGLKWIGFVLPVNVLTKTLWECEKKHKFESRYNSIQQGQGCPFCAGVVRKTKRDYHELANNYGFEWVGKKLPRNVFIKTLWRCKKCKNIWEARYNNIYNGYGCPVCKNIINGAPVSKPQIKLNNLLCGSLNYPESRYRIDVAIMRRSQKIAVEYDCWYWHQGKEKQEVKRDKFLISRGWKVLHVKAREMLPTRKQLNIAINYLVDTNNSLYNLYLGDWKIDIRLI